MLSTFATPQPRYGSAPLYRRIAANVSLLLEPGTDGLLSVRQLGVPFQLTINGTVSAGGIGATSDSSCSPRCSPCGGNSGCPPASACVDGQSASGGAPLPSKAPPSPTATKSLRAVHPVPESPRQRYIGQELRDLETLAVPSPAMAPSRSGCPNHVPDRGRRDLEPLLDDAQPVWRRSTDRGSLGRPTPAPTGRILPRPRRARKTAIEEALIDLITANRERWTRPWPTPLLRSTVAGDRAHRRRVDRVAAAPARCNASAGDPHPSDRVSQEVGRCEDIAGGVWGPLRAHRRATLHAGQSVPLWTPGSAHAFLELPDRIRMPSPQNFASVSGNSVGTRVVRPPFRSRYFSGWCC